jgi:hypothetical protein
MLEEASRKMLTKKCWNIYKIDEKLLETLRKKCCNIFENVETFLF